ncbi:MAG: condensation domain-containing protein, partial [Bacteroidota bacterium]
MYILNSALRPQPVGVMGELYIGGIQVARGYLNRAELSRQKFIENPFAKPGYARLYRTGDLARWMPDGSIDFIGRMDHQLKIRGQRIELGEIEQAILQYSDDIRQLVILPKEIGGQKQLAAYLVVDDLDKTALRQFLQEQLPEYMIPSYYLRLDALPLTANGKLDRRALPAVSGQDLARRTYMAPRTKAERQMVDIWQRILQVEQIGITDNFFELGGHSLLVTRLINEMHRGMGRKIAFKEFFANPTIEGLSRPHQSATYSSIPLAPQQASYPLTATQNRIWVLSQLDGGSTAYNMPGAVRITGQIDLQKFEQAFAHLLHRHEALRTHFRADETGQVRQFILPVDDLDFHLIKKDFQHRTNPTEATNDFLQEMVATEFDLTTAPLLQAALVKMEEESYAFCLNIHHLIADGWSVEIVIREMIYSYNCLVSEKDINLPALSVQYKDYGMWLETERFSVAHRESEQYWLNQFQGNIPLLDIPGLHPRPAVRSFQGRELSQAFSSDFLDQLQQFAERKQATLFMLLMAGINALLHRYSNQTEFIVGSPIAGREHAELEHTIGVFLNTLAIRTSVEPGEGFDELLQRQKDILLEAYEHQSYPFGDLVSKLPLKRDPGRSALFDVMLVFQSQENLLGQMEKKSLQELAYQPMPIPTTRAQFDLTFTFTQRERLELHISYNSDIYTEEFIRPLFGHFEQLLRTAMDDPTLAIQQIDLLKAEEKDRLLHRFNDSKLEIPTTKTVIEQFDACAKRFAKRPAVVYKDCKLSYGKLSHQVNALAAYLHKEHQLKTDDLVGIQLERTEQMVVAVLAVLKAGAAYIPIDPAHPEERIAFIKSDSQCKLVIEEKMLSQFDAIADAYADVSLQVSHQADQLAYVLYTSGTTGQPKGVQIEHRSLSNLIHWFVQRYDIQPSTVALQLTDLSFDPSVEDIFATLTQGGTYHVIPKELLLDVPKLREYISEHGGSILNHVPKFLHELLSNQDRLPSVQSVISGGEKMQEHIKEGILAAGYALYNNYGPTET